MSVDLEPKTLELVQRGATAALLLDAQRQIIGECVERVLQKIDHAVTNSLLDSSLAIGLCHEIAAFRRIVQTQKNHVETGRRAQMKDANG